MEIEEWAAILKSFKISTLKVRATMVEKDVLLKFGESFCSTWSRTDFWTHLAAGSHSSRTLDLENCHRWLNHRRFCLESNWLGVRTIHNEFYFVIAEVTDAICPSSQGMRYRNLLHVYKIESCRNSSYHWKQSYFLFTSAFLTIVGYTNAIWKRLYGLR